MLPHKPLMCRSCLVVSLNRGARGATLPSGTAGGGGGRGDRPSRRRTLWAAAFDPGRLCLPRNACTSYAWHGNQGQMACGWRRLGAAPAAGVARREPHSRHSQNMRRTPHRRGRHTSFAARMQRVCSAPDRARGTRLTCPGRLIRPGGQPAPSIEQSKPVKPRSHVHAVAGRTVEHAPWPEHGIAAPVGTSSSRSTQSPQRKCIRRCGTRRGRASRTSRASSS